MVVAQAVEVVYVVKVVSGFFGLFILQTSFFLKVCVGVTDFSLFLLFLYLFQIVLGRFGLFRLFQIVFNCFLFLRLFCVVFSCLMCLIFSSVLGCVWLCSVASVL